jgi:hypothetical protein
MSNGRIIFGILCEKAAMLFGGGFQMGLGD